MDTEPNKSKSLEYTLGIIILLGAVAASFLRNDAYMKNRGVRGILTQAYSNAKQIGLALLEFEAEYGAYPSAATVALVTTENPTHGYDLSGISSNAAFLQILATGITQSEEIFYARIPGVIKPDNFIIPGEALKKGEVGFSYISGLTSAGTDPNTPIVLTPLIPGTTKFDPKPFNGKAFVLHIDYSARTYDIHKDGHIYDTKGIDLLSAKNPIWKGKAPDIRYPE